MSMSTSSNQSSSSSTPQVTETPENALIDQISGVAEGLAGQMESWANGVFAQTSAVTNEAVGNFMQASQQMMGLAGNMTNQYNTEFAPENTDLINDANEYASTSRMQTDMGQAGATQAQAGDQAIKNSEANLVSMGIDPSSGRYAALDKAAAVQNAANVAGAENTQRNADVATGQALRSEAVQVGSQLPSAITNATNASTQANAAAANAEDANANTGANLQSLADKYLSTAMGVKLPLQGQKSTSQSTGTSNSNSQKPASPSGSGGGAGGGGNGTPSGGGFNPGMGPNTAAMGNDGGAGGHGQPNSQLQHPTDAQQSTDNYDPNMTAQANMYNQDMYGENGDGGVFGGIDSGQWTNPVTPDQDPYNAASSTPFSDGDFGQTYNPTGQSDATFGGMGGGTDTEWGNISYDPQANGANPFDTGSNIFDNGATTVENAGDWGQFGSLPLNQVNQPTDQNTDWGNGASDPYGDAASDYQDDSADGSAANYSDYQDQSQDDEQDASDDDGGDYAGGGSFNGGLPRPAAPPMQARRPQPQATTGGPVRPSMSPSGGARTDDVNAHLNADEFVLPKDVVKWKGEEFMHKLIADSRMKRQKMAAALGTGGKPSQGPKPAGPPRFNSRPMGQ